jgi:hypothetical protein
MRLMPPHKTVGVEAMPPFSRTQAGRICPLVVRLAVRHLDGPCVVKLAGHITVLGRLTVRRQTGEIAYAN